ncbi:MAG: hypothetical protein J5658_04430 [Prevotella sp.]|nr:hypothetical protein [Prevotella sp.]
MKKGLVILVSAMVLLSSCGTYTAQGAATGGWFGSMIGSAIGGISGGHRGSDIGSLIGMAGGAMIGAAIGQAADDAEQQKYEEYKAARQRSKQRTAVQRQADDYAYSDDSGFDANNGGDDRLFGFGEDLGGPSSYSDATIPEALEIRNARILDASRDGMLMRGEEARVVFEIYNNSSKPVFGVQPSVSEISGNKHIHISENILIESIAPGKGIRYTASIKADSGLKDGQAVIRIGVLQANKEITSQTRQFTIQTNKK